jgi:hypothetical protein
MKISERLREQLVDDARQAWRWWSVRWAALGAIMLPLLQVLPPALPPELQALLPPSVRAITTGLWCIGFLILRVAAQGRRNG